MNRAASSIPANIAEGSRRRTAKDQARFIQITLGSTFELETFRIGVTELKLLETVRVAPLIVLIKEEQKMLSGFLNKLET